MLNPLVVQLFLNVFLYQVSVSLNDEAFGSQCEVCDVHCCKNTWSGELVSFVPVLFIHLCISSSCHTPIVMSRSVSVISYQRKVIAVNTPPCPSYLSDSNSLHTSNSQNKSCPYSSPPSARKLPWSSSAAAPLPCGSNADCQILTGRGDERLLITLISSTSLGEVRVIRCSRNLQLIRSPLWQQTENLCPTHFVIFPKDKVNKTHFLHPATLKLCIKYKSAMTHVKCVNCFVSVSQGKSCCVEACHITYMQYGKQHQSFCSDTVFFFFLGFF